MKNPTSRYLRHPLPFEVIIPSSRLSPKLGEDRRHRQQNLLRSNHIRLTIPEKFLEAQT